MSVTPVGNLSYCKGLWSVISGTTCRCDKELVQDEIKNATTLLKDGILYFKKYTEASLQTVLKTEPPPKMYDFIGKLAPLLNLDATITWDLVCNYMLYEYRNCAETFASQLTDLTSMHTLIEDIWNFYYVERITLIKCLKLMFEYQNNKKHPHQKEFVKFFSENSINHFLDSVRKQIEVLKFLNPPSRCQLFTEEHLHGLYNSSLIEMRELLHILTIILHDIHIPSDMFSDIYGSISGEPRRLTSSKNYADREAVQKKIEDIQYSQTALLVIILDVMKHSYVEDWIMGLRSNAQDILEHKCVRDNSPQNGPLLLAWMLANYALEPDNMDVLNRYKPFGVRAIQLNVFCYLQGLMESEMIKEDTHYASTVRNSVYNLLMLLGMFVDEDRLGSFSGLFDLVATVLRYPENAERFWQEKDEGLWIFYNYAIQWFPYKFDPLTTIAAGLANASMSSAKKVIQELEEIPTITLEISRRELSLNNPLRPYERECLVHRNSYTIPRDCKYMKLDLPRGTSTEHDECEVVMWYTKSNYWDAFHYKIEQLFLQASGGIANLIDTKTPLPEQVTKGFMLLEALLSADTEISRSMVIPTELSFEVVNRFACSILPVNIYSIIAACFRISSKLVLRYPEDVLSRMRTGVFPRFDDRYQKTSEFAQAVSFDGGLVGSWLSSIETIKHTYPILNAYLDTLSNYLIVQHSKEAMYAIEIPGMILLLQSVLPKLDSWYFHSDAERVDLWLKSIFCLHRALDSVSEEKGESRNELRLIVTYNLLHLEPRHALLKVVRTGERTLRNKMMNETDWIAGKGFKVIKTVQLALSVINRLLMYRKNLGLDLGERSPLEVALYASPSLPKGLLIVPTIVDYLYVWFSPALQAMAVRLLKKFAEGFSMSLLVCMGMDGTSIRETFASRLMSPTCAAEVKVAILELVTICLDKQPGLTEALFNIIHPAERKRIFPRPADEFLTVGCTRFLNLYMQRIKKEEDIVYDRLYDSTMSLLRAMWYHRNEILVNFFRKRTDFWNHLFAPLFRKLVPNIRGYSQLLDIITLELFKSPQLEKEFSSNLKTLLDASNNHWEKLAVYILNRIPTEEEQMDIGEELQQVLDKDSPRPLYETNLESWYQLLIIITDERIIKNYSIAPSQAQFTTHLALDRLLKYMKQLPPSSANARASAAKIMTLLTSLSLRCISSWKYNCIGDSSDMKTKLANLMQEVAQSYRSYGKSLKQVLVALLVGIVELVPDALSQDNSTLEYLLGQACIIATEDLEELKEVARSHSEKQKHEKIQKQSQTIRAGINQQEEVDLEAQRLAAMSESIPATLTVCLVTRLLRMRLESSIRGHRRKIACSQLRLLVAELMTCISMILQKRPHATFSKAALTLLGTVARSPYDLNTIDGDASVKLWLALIPPKDIQNSLLSNLYNDFVDKSKWRCEDWWPIYTTGLEFLIGLVTNETGSTYINQVMMFLGSHEYLLMEISTLLRHTADPLAADLLQSLIVFISSLSTRPIFWESIQPSIRETMVKCTYLAYDSTVNLLLRPRILKFIIDGISVESAEELQSCDETLPSGELKLLVNKLILINTFCAQSFVHFSPRLNALVDTIYEQDDFWYAPMAEMNFGPPQMCINSAPRLTYGTIISSTQLFTQAQLHSRPSLDTSVVPSSSFWTSGVNRTSTVKDDKIDSARREWERATPENLRRMHAKDLRKILHTGSSIAGANTNTGNFSSNIDFSGYLTGLDVTVPLLGNPRLIRRPFDPLICENTILSRATALVPVPGRVVKGSNSPSNSKEDNSNTNRRNQQARSRAEGNSGTSDPWFSSMEENNTRLALEVNLVLILCQALEGVKSPRLVLRDRQLIARETATEVGVFFDFLEHKSETDDWKVAASLVDVEPRKTIVVSAEKYNESKLPARLHEGSTITKWPQAPLRHMTNYDEVDDDESIEILTENETEERLNQDIITSGGFDTPVNTTKLLSLLGKLLKTVVESLDSTHFG